MTRLQVETLRQLQALGVRFLLVGGQAMRARGIDRPTHDLDLWIARDEANAHAMSRFLERAQQRPSVQRLLESNLKLTVGDPQHPEVDILTSVAGDPDFEECAARSEVLRIDGQWLPVIAATDLVSVKQASAALMDRDGEDAALTVADRTCATRTAQKERRDIALLNILLAASG